MSNDCLTTYHSAKAKKHTRDGSVDGVVEAGQDQGRQVDTEDFHVVLVNSLGRVVGQDILLGHTEGLNFGVSRVKSWGLEL